MVDVQIHIGLLLTADTNARSIFRIVHLIDQANQRSKTIGQITEPDQLHWRHWNASSDSSRECESTKSSSRRTIVSTVTWNNRGFDFDFDFYSLSTLLRIFVSSECQTSITSAGLSGVCSPARSARVTFITAIIHKYIPIGQFIGLNFVQFSRHYIYMRNEMVGHNWLSHQQSSYKNEQHQYQKQKY